MERLAYKEDCEIIRNREVADIPFNDRAVLMDCDGEVVFDVDNSWTDEQVWEALRLMDVAFGKGVDVGKSSKACEIRRALDL